MVDEDKVWRIQNEGNLARNWEERLKPRTEPHVRRKKRVLAPWARTVLWIGSIWSGALVASFLAIHVMMMSYHYDQLNQQYANLARKNQTLAAALAQKTSAQSLAQDAAKLHVSVQNVKVKPVLNPIKPAQPTPPAPSIHSVTTWIRQLSRSLIQ